MLNKSCNVNYTFPPLYGRHTMLIPQIRLNFLGLSSAKALSCSVCNSSSVSPKMGKALTTVDIKIIPTSASKIVVKRFIVGFFSPLFVSVQNKKMSVSVIFGVDPTWPPTHSVESQLLLLVQLVANLSLAGWVGQL